MVEKRVIADSFTLTLQDVMYGITKECSVLFDLINNIILLSKFFIHKCRYFKSPLLCLKYFSDALSETKNTKTVKL